MWIWLLVIAAVATAAASVTDLRSGTIPNALTLPLGVVSPLLHAVLLGLEEPVPWYWLLLDSFAGAFVCGIVPAMLWYMNGLGGGDLKLLVALGGLLGVRPGLDLELFSFAAAAVLCPVILAFHGKLLSTLKSTGMLAVRLVRPSIPRGPRDPAPMTRLRFAPAIFAATLLLSAFEATTAGP